MPLGRTLRAGHAFVTAGRLQRLFFALKYFSHRQVAENRHSSIKYSLLYLNVLSPEYAQISGRDCTHLLFQNIQTFYSASEMSFTIFFFKIWLCQVLIVACVIFFSCGKWALAPQPGIEPKPPTLGAWSHGTTLWLVQRKVPVL